MITVDTTSLFTFTCKIADDNLVLAQQLGALVSHLPELEEDIAIANISLDHLGQARAFLTYAGEVEGIGRDEDDLAMGRDEREFLNAVLVERPNGDFAHVMARQLFVDAYQVPFYAAVAAGRDETLAGIASKAEKEARYHREHSAMWVVRLGDGTDESHRRMQTAVDELWKYSGDLFEPTSDESDLLASLDVDLSSIRDDFDHTIDSTFGQAGISRPEDPYQRLGGRDGRHTEHLGHVLAEMQWLHRSHPGVEW